MPDYAMQQKIEKEQRGAIGSMNPAEGYYPTNAAMIGKQNRITEQPSLATVPNEIVSIIHTAISLCERIEKVSLKLTGSISAPPDQFEPGSNGAPIDKDMPTIMAIHFLLTELQRKLSRAGLTLEGVENVI